MHVTLPRQVYASNAHGDAAPCTPHCTSNHLQARFAPSLAAEAEMVSDASGTVLSAPGVYCARQGCRQQGG
jgi:hypothetical protein